MISLHGPTKFGNKTRRWLGIGVCVLLMFVMVLASGFMIKTINTDTFWVSFHAMNPFHTPWGQVGHGDKKPQYFVFYN